MSTTPLSPTVPVQNLLLALQQGTEQGAGLIELLVGIAPYAAGLTILAILVAKKNSRASSVAIYAAVAVLVFLAGVDVWDRLRPVSVVLEPNDFLAFASSGPAVSVTAYATRGDEVMDSISNPAPPLSEILSRSLTATRVDGDETVLQIEYRSGVLGRVDRGSIDRLLRAPAAGQNQPSLSTGRVFEREQIVWDCSFGRVRLTALEYDITVLHATVRVAVEDEGLGNPVPDALRLPFHSVGEVFVGGHRLFVALREANRVDNRMWAAYTIIPELSLTGAEANCLNPRKIAAQAESP